jgi:hypothetical protein
MLFVAVAITVTFQCTEREHNLNIQATAHKKREKR